jgi:fumarylacetoacetate (FAA) hydrolase family protein
MYGGVTGKAGDCLPMSIARLGRGEQVVFDYDHSVPWNPGGNALTEGSQVLPSLR